MSQAPTIDEFISAYLMGLRAPKKERFVSTSGGTARIKVKGERVIFGPRGEKIRILEDENDNTQVEVGDQLHAVVRPLPVRIKVSQVQASRMASALGHPDAIRTTVTPKGP